MILAELHVGGWRQYSRVNIKFHPRLTVLTGENGAGKTTLLNLLSQNYGWQVPLIGTPSRKGGPLKYLTDLWDRVTGHPQIGAVSESISFLQLANGQRSDLICP